MTAIAERPDTSVTPGMSDAGVFHPRFDLNQLRPSKTNPRKHFDQAKLLELAASLKEHGVIQPLTARRLKGSTTLYEIVAGERRYRAAILAELKSVPVLERALTDEQVVEIQLIENIQRDDLTALEQARGYRSLIDSNPGKHTAASIATRVGMSEAWVWDRLKLNDLIPAAKTLLEEDRIATGHAILIARQKPDDQKRIIHFASGGLFEDDGGFEFSDEDAAKLKGKKANDYDGLKPVSVRELEKWIADHIRFDITHAAKAVPLQFETAAAKVEAAAAQPGRGKKVIAITFEDGQIAEEAKAADERTYGRKSWRLADGTKKSQRIYQGYRSLHVDSPACEYAVLGLVAVGQEHYGETFPVCIARDKCLTHWGVEIRAREKTAKLRETGQGKKASAREAAAQRQSQAADEKRQADRARFDQLKPALRKATLAAAAKLTVVKGNVFTALLKAHRLPASTKPATLAHALLIDTLESTFQHAWYNDEPRLVAWAKLLGVDVKACEPKPAKKETAA